MSAVASTVTTPPKKTDASNHLALGVPRDGDDSDDVMIDHGVFVLSYNPKMSVANWVAWHLVDDDLGEVDRSDAFHTDDELPLGIYHVKPDDYAHSGLDRGHLCPSADRTSDVASNALTFLMTNMHPQEPALNRVTWKALEVYERKLVTAEHKSIFIVAGGLFSTDPRSLGHGIAVPSAEYKIIVVLEDGQDVDDVTANTHVIAVIMPNTATVKSKPWTSYLVTVDEVEERTGYDFLSAVPDDVEDALEGRAANVH